MVLSTDRDTVGAAPDNLRSPDTAGRKKSISNTADAKKDNRLRSDALDAVDYLDRSDPTSIVLEKVDSADRDSNQLEKTSENNSSRRMTSLLTSLNGVDQARLSPIQQLGRSPINKLTHPVEGHINNDQSDHRSQRLQQLEEDVCQVNERLQQA